MKLCSVSVQGRATWGIAEADRFIDVGSVLGDRYPSLKHLVASAAYSEAEKASATAPRLALKEIAWDPVIPNPDKILCIGLNYETHRKEAGRDKTGYPAVFTRFADSQMGHEAPIIRPRVSSALDYEGELAIIIGKPGRYIAQADAMNHVAGYTCYNDASIRDWQRHTIQFTPGKNFPGTGACGPIMVTADEIADYRSLKIVTRLNGESVQSAGLDQLIFDIPTLIEYCSSFTPLSAGDIIATGTPGGVGFKREPPLYMKPGDQVEVDIPGVGLLLNGVEDEV